MKKGFTLIELLITVTVMVTLMAIVFRLSSVSDDQSKRTNTVICLQKLENCLSGYYAAFGSYPPVQLHGSRDIYLRIDSRTGMQSDQNAGSTLNWQQVEAACRSQPVGCSYPIAPEKQPLLDLLAEELVMRKQAGMIDADVSRLTGGLKMPSPGEFTSVWNEYDWREVQLFKFGLMSYLLPRYLVMTKSDRNFFGDGGMGVPKQWSVNNNDPIDATTGARVDTGEARAWSKIYDYTRTDTTGQRRGRPSVLRDYIRVANMPTQAVCARWIPNLEGLCTGWSSHYLFGVEVTGTDAGSENTAYNPMLRYMLDHPTLLEVYTTEGGASYTLDFVKVKDGYDNELYYYSPPGYQSYTLWSAGANRMTFPPWMSVSEFDDSDRKTIRDWTRDDITRMKN